MRGAAWGVVVAVSLAVAAGAVPAVAADPAAADPHVVYPDPVVNVYADLEFVREQSTSLCPGEQGLRDLIMSHTGYDVFTANPRGVYVGRVRVILSRVPGGFAGTYTWTDTQGVERHDRFVQRGEQWFHCKTALDDVATALYVELSSLETELGAKYAKTTTPPYCPTTLPQTAAACPESKTAPLYPDSRFAIWPTEWPLPPLEKPKPDPPAPLERWPVAVRLGVAVWPELIADGWGSLGFTVDAGVRYRAVSFSAEIHGDPPLGSQTFQDVGAVGFARLSGAMLLCGHWGWFVGCGVGDAGRFIFPDHVPALPASTFYGAAGVRAKLEFPVAPPLVFLSVAVDLRAPIPPVNYVARNAGTTVFETAGPAFGLGLGLLWELSPAVGHQPPSLPPSPESPPSQPGGAGPASTSIGHDFSGPHGS
jgi:hypothetical protein